MAINNKQLHRIAERREALDSLMIKYPKGFTLSTLLKENADLYKNRKQANDFMLSIRQTDTDVAMKYVDKEYIYYVTQDPYKLLNKLWRIPNV